jgi:hypothetical protein
MTLTYYPGICGPVAAPLCDAPPAPPAPYRLSVQSAADAGATLTFTPAGSGHWVPTGAGLGLLVNNTGDTPVTVTIPLAATYDNLPISPRTMVVAAGSVGLLPLPAAAFLGAPALATYSGADVSAAVIWAG